MLLRISCTYLLVCVCFLDSSVRADSPNEREPNKSISFAADIRPILSDHCFACHGPDEHDRQADLRLDTEEGLSNVVDVMDPGSSDLLARVLSDDVDAVMPPPEFNKPLSKAEKRLIDAWIHSGAQYEGHWAFQPVVVLDRGASHGNAVDELIDRAIERQGLVKNGPADKEALFRRVCLDLTGLPLSRQQIDSLNEGKWTYEKWVDELLGSPAFGQHWGRYWLDLVRYADTHGLHLDNYREMWPYRDWVIDAINQNMPFDQFITEQLAGDLLPAATESQQIASGFNRLNVTTSEGGSIYEEVFARNCIDRTNAFGTIFLGLTTQCAVCHDHKFDPITQKDYYSLLAFFNSLDGRALDGNKKDHPPILKYPTEMQRAELRELKTQLASLRKDLSSDLPSVDKAQLDWEGSLRETADRSNGVEKENPAGRRSRLIPSKAVSESNASLVIEKDGLIRQEGEIAATDIHSIVASLPGLGAAGAAERDAWQTLRLSVVPDPKTNRGGVSPNGNAVLSEIVVQTRPSNHGDDGSNWTSIEIGSAIADIQQDSGVYAVSKAIDGQSAAGEGWAIAGHEKQGGRTAEFHIPMLKQRIMSGHDEIRIQLKYLSKFAKHQFYGVRVGLSDQPPVVDEAVRIKVADPFSVGPFAVESAAPGFSRKFASQETAFDANATFKYQDKVFAWRKQEDWAAVQVHSLPALESAVSVNLVYFSIESPSKQSVELLLGSSDGHSVILNTKRLADSKRTGSLRTLGSTYKLDLKKGKNDLYLKFVSSTVPGKWNYAFRSSSIAIPDSVTKLVSKSSDERSKLETAAIRKFYREVVCQHPDWLALKDMIAGTESAIEKLNASIPTTLVWKELPKPREAKILRRGQYDQPGETVERATPSFLPPMKDEMRRDRLGLATWLLSPDHPLTARVAVNRFWQSLFGAGLVKSSEDFGNQGQPPSHPELLDYLAWSFQQSGWDVKQLIRQIVTSQAYRRSSKVLPRHLELDPENRFLARGPRHRLDAEVLRDQSLALAGLLREDAGGPSIKPPQPSGLWYAVGYTRSNTANFKADPEPEKVHRRSVYIFWKRTSAPPQMSTFDAPSRESCTARRERTNTPLQALLLMNEHQYLQASKHLAIRALTECSSPDPNLRLRWLFETVTARRASDAEYKELRRLLDQLIQHYMANVDAAHELLSIDEVKPDGIAAEKHAAWMMVASTLLNLDEVVNK